MHYRLSVSKVHKTYASMIHIILAFTMSSIVLISSYSRTTGGQRLPAEFVGMPRNFAHRIHTKCNLVELYGINIVRHLFMLCFPSASLQNELIDALECLASLAIMSGMSLEEKVR